MAQPSVIAEIETVLEAAAIPYLDTINTRPTAINPTLTPEWTTLELDISNVDRISLGRTGARFREEGSVTIVVNTRSGEGKQRGYELSEEIRSLFWEYSSGFLRIIRVSSGVIYQPEDGNWFQVRIPIDYQFDFTK